MTPQLHQAALTTLRDRYARVLTVQEAIEDIRTYASQTVPR